MTIKPFAIQGSDLTLGGVNLQAGATTIVIPGVTRATSYVPEEINDTGDQTHSFNSPPVVIDHTFYSILNGDYSPSGYTEAEYAVTELDGDDYIDGIDIVSPGSGWNLTSANGAQNNDMWAYVGSAQNPFATFVNTDWIQVPFRVKIRAGDVETIGGGGAGIVERAVVFPGGASGDTAGILASDSGTLYYSTGDYTDVNDIDKIFEVETTENYDVTQSGGTINSIRILAADYPGIKDILDTLNNTNTNYDFTVNGGPAFGGSQPCSNISYNGTTIDFQWPHRTGVDPTTIEQGDSFMVEYVGSIPQPAIWTRILSSDISVEIYPNSSTELTVADKDFELRTTRSNPGQDADIGIYAADDLWLEAAGDDVQITAADEVRIISNNANNSYEWKFDATGRLQLPQNGDIVDSNGTSVLGGGASGVDPNVWVQTFVSDSPTTDFPQVATSVEYDADGNVIALFSHAQTDGIGPDSRYYSVGKYTTTGSKIWTARFAADLNTDGWGLAVDNTDGWIYIAGQTGGDTYAYNQATLAKIDSGNGNVEWSKLYDFGYDSSSAVVDVDSAGNPVMVGYVNVNNNSSESYLTVTKVNKTDGTVTWSRKLDGQADEQAYGMGVGPDGEIVAVGYMDELAGVDSDDRIVVVKYDSTGTIAWQKAIQFDAGWNCTGTDADIDSQGNIYICGQYTFDYNGGPGTGSGMSLVKFNSSGVKQWSRRVVGDCVSAATSIVVGPDDKLYISGVNGNIITETFTWVVAKYSLDGLVEWQRFMENNTAWTFSGQFFNGEGGGSNLAVRQGYLALAGGFGDLALSQQAYATVLQVPATGNVFTVGNWDFKAANLSGVLNGTASDIVVVNAGLTDSDNSGTLEGGTVVLNTEVSTFLIGTLFTAPGAGDNELTNGDHVFALESDGTLTLDGNPFNGNGFTVLADGTLQANVDGTVTTATIDLTTGLPGYLTITPRSPDRDTLDTHYGFNSTGMWFTGNNEETLINQPAYPIHTTDSFPADVKVVVEFDFNLVSGEEDWGICVYPADGVPHWSWEEHPSRIAATVDCSTEPTVAQAEIHGFTDSNYGDDTADVAKARFTYDPVAELTTLELLNADNEVTSRAQLPGRLPRDQNYMIGFDADWDEAGPTDKSYFTSLTITSGNTADAKATELTVTGEVKLPSTTKGFINLQGPWINGDDNIQFQSVAAHNGYAYMIGMAEWAENNRTRIDKYSLTSGELVWTRILGAGRDAQFDISWTGGTYTIDDITNQGIGYQAGELLYIAGAQITGGQNPANLVTITVQSVGNQGNIVTATIAGTAPSGTSSQTGITEFNSDGRGDPTSIKYDTVTDTLVVLTAYYTALGDADDSYWDRALVTRINPVSGDVLSTVALGDEGDIHPYDVAVHPTTGATAVVGEKYNEYRTFGTLTMLAKGVGYFDILKSNLDPEHYPGNDLPNEYASDFWISGTGITNKENVDNVNYYEGITTTVRQGTGATFNIANNGDGTYSVNSITNGGTNYRAGHKIKVLGTSLSGAENTFAYDFSYGGGYGAWKVTDDTLGNLYLIFLFPAQAQNPTIINLLAIGDSVTIEWGGQQHTTTIAGAVGPVPNDPYLAGHPDSVGFRLTDNFGETGQQDRNVGTITTGNGVYLGLTPDNDATITVTGATNGVIDTVSISGTASGGVGLIDVGGTNIDVGSGLTLDIQVDAVTGSRIANTVQQGSNYVVNDVIIIPGTIFVAGATPANDVEVTITAVEGQGSVSQPGVVTAGTTPTNAIRVFVDGVDFTVSGAWTMKQNLAGEAFVWTSAWDKAIGGASNDKFQSVVYSKDGTSIYAVGDGRYEVNYSQSLVVKFATSDGTIGFSKYLNSATENSYASGVAVIGTSDIVVAGYEYNIINSINRDHQFVARLSSSGTVIWKKFYGDGNWENYLDYPTDIQVDSDDNIYVTTQLGADDPYFGNRGFHVTKLDRNGNLLWTRCVSGSDTNYLNNWNGSRFSSLANGQLVVAGYTYATDDNYYSGLWASFPTDGFTYFGGEGEFVQQGAFRFSQGRIVDGVRTFNTGGSFTPSIQAPNITAGNNLKKYATRTPIDRFEQHLHKMVDPKHGGLVFGDGSRQTFATDKIPQIKADRGYTITAQDSGKHIYYKNNSGTVLIPVWAVVDLPVGFTFTIINRSGNHCYVELTGWPGPIGTIYGAGRNLSYNSWGIPDSGSGSMVTLILVEAGKDLGNGNYTEPVWMISGPGDIYIND